MRASSIEISGRVGQAKEIVDGHLSTRTWVEAKKPRPNPQSPLTLTLGGASARRSEQQTNFRHQW